MAQPKTFHWAKLLLMVGNNDTVPGPETFSPPCGITSRGINHTADTSTSVIPDCADPSLPTWAERVARSLSAGVDGSGVATPETIKLFSEWFYSGQPRNCKVKLDVPAVDNGVSWEGPFVLTRFNPTGNEPDGKVGLTIALESAGKLTPVLAV